MSQIPIRSSIYEKIMDELVRWQADQPYRTDQPKCILIDREHLSILINEISDDEMFSSYVTIPIMGFMWTRIHDIPVKPSIDDVVEGVMVIQVIG